MSLREAMPGRPDGPGGRRPRVSDRTSMTQYAVCDAWVIGARGDYDMDSVPGLADALAAASEEHPRIVLDASGITFADSSLLNILILTHRTADLRVAAPTEQLRRLLHITGADTVLKVAGTVEEAAAAE